jgi:uncharacterized protein
MSIELRPLGVACNLACHYCYQNPQRDAGNQRMTYDLEKMKKEAARIGGPFILFGGEPLLMRFEDLEHLFAWGLETTGSNCIQTNGVLIEDRHIDLFRRYKVSVGISIDGPGELNDARWHRGLEKTRQSTAAVEAVIERLCREYQAPGLIVTLHKGNATADRLPLMAEWFRKLHAIGIRGVRLHLLEVDHHSVRDTLALSARENIQALLAFAEIQESIPGMRLDLFDEIEALLNGQDKNVGCTWRACDPYTTEAVQGIEGNGQSSNCGRTNKEGIGFTKSNTAGYERYRALYRTPQSENGCAGCRFFLMCKGQCPGTSIGGDWRNRTEHCEEWKELFNLIERRMIVAGKIPLTIQPVRFELEQRQLEAWENGENPSISRGLSALSTTRTPRDKPKPKARISWVGDQAREKWQPRLEQLPTVIENLTVHSARANNDRCAARLVPASSFDRLTALAAQHGMTAAILPAEALPAGICTHPAESITGVFLAGTPAAVAAAESAWATQDLAAFQALLDVPACCTNHGSGADSAYLPESIPTHSLLAPLGISALPVAPCRFDCPEAIAAAAQWMNLAAQVCPAEAAWLRECFSWSISWSDLHGVTEIKTPLFKMCLETESTSRARLIRRAGTNIVEGGAQGLTFPYAPPPRMVEISGVL